MKFNSLADVLVHVDGLMAEHLSRFANDVRTKGPASGLTPEAIEDAIAFALAESDTYRETARQQVLAMVAESDAQ